MINWLFQTLKSYPEIAIFLSLAFGYYVGSFTYKGLGLGAVTATLIAAVVIGQIGITISGPLKPTFFLMFLFAIGYGVGPNSCAASRRTAYRKPFSRRSYAYSASGPVISVRNWPGTMSDLLSDSTRAPRPFRHRWALRRTRSIASDYRRRKPRSCSTRCRLHTRSPISSARSDPPSSWR